MSNDDKKPSFSSPLAKFQSFDAKNANLFSTFNRVQSPTAFLFASRAPLVAAPKPLKFDSKRVSGDNERSVSGKSGGGGHCVCFC